MKLLLEEMYKRWTLYNEFTLNKEFLKSVWVFYSLYDICLVLCNAKDNNINLKNNLIYRFIVNPSDIEIYNKIKRYMVEDVEIINMAMNKLENVKGGGVLVGDYKKPTMFAINVNE